MYFRNSVIFKIALLLVLFTDPLYPKDDVLNFFELSRVNGLSNNNVTAIARDSKGYMWFGTENGLNRYNGYEFKKYNTSNYDTSGLHDNHITSLQIDQEGRLWIGGISTGLARYEPITGSFIKYNFPDISEYPRSDNIISISVDKQGHIWIATGAGLYLYNSINDSFGRIRTLSDDNNNTGELTVFSNHISSITPDENTGIWIVYNDWAISYLDPSGNSSTHYTSMINEKLNPVNKVNDILFCGGELYLATTNQGVKIYDPLTDKSRELLENDFLLTATSFIEHRGTIWITSWNGLLRYDKITGNYYHFTTDPGDPKSLTSGSSKSLYTDDTGILWLGVGGKGLNYAMINLPFRNIYESAEDPEYLYHPNISSMLSDSSGSLWVAFQSGIMQVYRPGLKYRQIIPVDQVFQGSGIGHIFDILETSDGNIYICSWQGGVHRYDKKQDRFVKLFDNYENYIDKFGGLDIRSLREGPDGDLWLAVFGIGVVKFNVKSEETRIFSESEDLLNPYVFDLNFDESGNLWVSSARGIYKLPVGDSTFIPYLKSDDINSISHNFNRLSFIDKSERIWFVSDNGLSLYNPDNDSFINFTNDNFGFPDIIIRSIEEDNNGNFWLSSSVGIIHIELEFSERYNAAIKDFFIYDLNHGILSDDFFPGSSTTGADGQLFFGGTKGIDYFIPDNIIQLKEPAVLQFDEIRIFNKIIHAGSPEGPETDKNGRLLMSYEDNTLSFSYVALNFIESSRNRYFYKLEPLHEEWYSAGFDRNATFMNLPSGNYTFRVRSCLSSTLCESGEISLDFYLKPPFWRTIPFISFVIVAFIVMMIAIPSIWTARIRRAKHRLERLVNHRTRELSRKNLELIDQSFNLAEANTLIEERSQEIEEKSMVLKKQTEDLHEANVQLNSLNSMKNRFFSIIAHDFRSPLSTVAGYSDLVLSRYEEFNDLKLKEILGTINSSVKNVLLMLDNLLRWANSQTNRLVIDKEEVSPYNIANEIFLLNKELFSKKNILFRNNVNKDLKLVTDIEMLRTILRNLLTNAVKFTPSGGSVFFEAPPFNETMLRFNVKDTGTGIPPELRDALFRIDFASSSPGTDGETGSGLGLIICQEFITKLGGGIWVEESSDQGTTFSFTLPA
jgi:signal transduction histidine kinase/ligand-binding sensor domain-containing protein